MVSIKHIVPTLAVIQILAAVGLTGVVSFLNGQKAVDELATKLTEEITNRIEERVETFLEKPAFINQSIVYTLNTGNLNSNNFSALERYFYYQVGLDNSTNNIYFANPQGEFLGVKRLDNSKATVYEVNKSTFPQRKIYNLNNGNRTQLISSQPNYDARTRPWYKVAIKTGKISWTPIYAFGSPPVLTTTQVVPVYNQQKQLIGVLGVDVVLSQISDFLRQLNITQSGKAFIIDAGGDIVASSTTELPFVATSKSAKRLPAIQSSDRTIQGAANQLLKQFGNFQAIKQKRFFNWDINGQNQIVQIAPLRSHPGLQLMVVVVIPKSDFMEKINANTQQTIIIIIFTLSVSITLAILYSRWLLLPILRLDAAAQSIENQNFDPNNLTDITKRKDEMGHLAQVFQHMASAVSSREQNFRQQLQELRTETDQARRSSLSAKLTQMSYLQQLVDKSKIVRVETEEYPKFSLNNLLQQVIYFSNFTEVEIQRLISLGHKKTLPKGGIICQEDEPGDAFYIILAGSVEIFLEKFNKPLANLPAGTFFGEFSLLLGIPRTATVRTLEDTILFVIDQKSFQKLLIEYPEIAEQLVVQLNERLNERKENLKYLGLPESARKFEENLQGIRERLKEIFDVKFTN